MWLSTYLLTVYSVLKPHVPNIFLLFRLWAFFLLKSILRVLKSHFHKVIIFALWNWLHPHCSGLVNQCIVVCPQDFCFWWAHVGNYACNNVLVKRNPERPVHEIVSRTMNSSHSGTLTGVWLKWKGFYSGQFLLQRRKVLHGWAGWTESGVSRKKLELGSVPHSSARCTWNTWRKGKSVMVRWHTWGLKKEASTFKPTHTE